MRSTKPIPRNRTPPIAGRRLPLCCWDSVRLLCGFGETASVACRPGVVSNRFIAPQGRTKGEFHRKGAERGLCNVYSRAYGFTQILCAFLSLCFLVCAAVFSGPGPTTPQLREWERSALMPLLPSLFRQQKSTDRRRKGNRCRNRAGIPPLAFGRTMNRLPVAY